MFKETKHSLRDEQYTYKTQVKYSIQIKTNQIHNKSGTDESFLKLELGLKKNK